jgi:SAM-dependent methyltransferase
MEPAEYGLMAAAEERMWWYRALHGHLTRWSEVAQPGPALRILDAGCGTGGVLKRLAAAARRKIDAYGLDFDDQACRFSAEKTTACVTRGSINCLPYADACFDLIISADVLSNRWVEESAALGEFRRCLAPDGRLILNLPAYEWMMGEHDRHVFNARRYTRGRIARRLSTVGLTETRSTYWNTIPFPVMALHRKVFARRQDASDVRLFPAPVEAAFNAAMGLEAIWLRAGLSLPFGGSVLVEAKRSVD